MKNKETSEIILHICLINKILFHAIIFVLTSKSTARAALTGNERKTERHKVYMMCSAQWNADLCLCLFRRQPYMGYAKCGTLYYGLT